MTIVHDVIDEHGNTVIAEETVKATFVYDAFNTRDRTTVDIPWSPEKNIAEYIGYLPTDVSYGYATDHRGVIEEKELTETRLVPGEHLIVTVVPQGGKIMAIVGMVIAVAVASVFTAGAAGAAFGGIFAGAGPGLWVGVAVAWIGAISTITQGVMSMTQKRRVADSSPSYGIDGPKATNNETTPVPYVYGTMRVAGNKVNIFTENVTSKRQKIYVQYVVSEGPVKAITDIEINQQPVDEYNNTTSSNKDNDDSDDDGLVVKTDYRLGTDTQDVMPWFASSLSQYNVQARLTEDFATYTTQEEVNRIRLDLAFPNGLYHVTHKKGKYVNSKTPITAEYALEGTDDWVSFAHDYEWSSIDYENNFTDIKVKGLRITVMVTGKDGSQNTPYNMLVQYRKATAANNTDTSTPWSTMGSESGNVTNTMLYENGSPVFKAGSYLKTFEVTGLDEDTYSFQTSGCTIVGVEAYYKQDLSWSLCTTTEYRMSVMSPPLPLGTYKVRVKRDNAESTETDTCNTLYLMDITQYQDNPVAYNNTAYYAAQIKLGTEISSEPSITALVQGRLVNIYDREGNVTAFQWSDNPADVALDILLNTNNNFGISASRIDFAAFDDWRKFCAENNLAFNGTFDTLTNVWDAVAEVTRVGRAGIALEGLSWTVVIERAADPVMMFGQAQIVKGSLTIQWTGRKDRANLYEIQYYDKNDKYKQHSVFAMDDTFITNGDALVQKTVTLTGVTDATQAQNEAWLLLNISRYVNQVCSFEVPYQAVGVAVGDVFLLQHDIVDWGNEARVKSVNGSTITLDQPVADTTQSWNLFLIQSLTNVAAGVITDVSGRDIVIQTLTAPIWTDADKTKPYYNSDQVTMNSDTDYMTVATSSDSQRIVINGVEYGVEDKTIVGTEIHFTLDVAPGSVTGQKAQIFNIDALCQAPLTFVSTNSDNTQVWKVGAWENERNATISVGARVLLGTSSVKAKPFRCTKITYKDDHTRTIAGAEYNESIYTANPQPAPNYSGLTEQPSQCSNVTYTLGNTVSQNGSLIYYADISWARPLNDQRIYKSAKIYVNRNYGGFVLEQEIQNPTQTCRLSVNLADVIQVRVLATYENNAQANYADAPTVTFEVVSETMVPDNIDNTTLKAVGGIRLISLTWTALNEPYIASYEIYEAPSDDITKGYRVYIGDANSFVRTGLDPNTTAYYWIRTVSTAGTVSEWSTSVSATTSYVLTSDLEADIANTATTAKQLLHDIGTPVAVEAASLPDAANYANGAYISYSTDGTNAKLFKNVNGTWTSVTGSVLVNPDGTISQATLPILSSDKVEQQLAENQIAMLKKAAEDSSLTADQKAAIQQAVAAGKAAQSVLNVAQQAVNNVTVSKVDNLSFSNISGQVTSDQIAALQASKIAGQLTSDQISAIDAVKVNGQITASQIASITAAQISTQLSSDQIEGLEAAKLIGQVTADQLTQAPSNNLIWDGCGQSSDGWVKYWDYLLTDSSISATDSSSAQYVPGLGSALISGHWNKAANGSVEYAWEEIDAIAGQYYELQGEFCCQYSANAYLILRFLDANGNSLGQYGTNSAQKASNPASGLAGYTFVWTKNVAPANTAKILVLVHIDADTSDTSDVQFQVNFTKILLGVSTKSATVPMTWVNGSKPLVSAVDIHGTISSVQISSVDVSKVTNLTFDKVGGALTTNQQAAIDVANTIGNVPASRIPSVNSTAINGQITTDQIASLDAAKLTSQIVGTQISDGAISANKISAGAVVSASIAAGAVTAEKLAVASPSNIVWNGNGFVTTDGWVTDWYHAGVSSYNGLDLGEGKSQVPSLGAFRFSGVWSKDSGGQQQVSWKSLLPVAHGQKIQAQALFLPDVNCTGYIQIFFRDKDGNAIQIISSDNVPNIGYQNTQPVLQQYQKASILLDVPENAQECGLVIGAAQTVGSNFEIFFTNVAFGYADANATEVASWTPGGVTQISGGQILTGSIQAGAIASNAITAEQINADSIRSAVLTAGSVTASQIAAGSIDASKINADSVRAAVLTANSISASMLQANSVNANNVDANSVSSVILTANSISTNMLQSGVVTADKIAANTITSDQIDANSIRTAILTANSISTNMLQSEAVTADKIKANTITASQIDASSISTVILTANSISSSMIQSSAITTDKISAGAVVAESIAASAVTAEKLTIGSPSNLIWNPCFSTTTDGWSWWDDGSLVRHLFRVTSGAQRLTGEGSAIIQLNNDSDTLVNGKAGIFWNPSNESDVNSAGIAVEAGQRVFMTAYVACGNGAIATVALPSTANLSVISGCNLPDTANVTMSNYPNPSSLSDYTRIGMIADVTTAGMIRPQIYIAGVNVGQPFIIVTRVQFGFLTSNVTEFPEYTPGGITSISGNMIQTGTMSADRIVANSITADQIDVGSISGNMIQTGTMSADRITANTITAAQINAASIQTAVLTSGSVVSDTIASNAVTTEKISAGAVTAQQIAASSVTAEKLTIGSPSNLIWNPCFSTTTDGWAWWDNGTLTGHSFIVAPSHQSLISDGGALIQLNNNSQTTVAGEVAGIYWNPTMSSVLESEGISVKAGQRIFMTAYVACGNGATARLDFPTSGAALRSVTGNLSNSNNTNMGNYPNPTSLDDYVRIGIIADVTTSGMVRPQIYIGGNGGEQPFVIITRVQFGFLTSNVTEFPEYTPGGITSISGNMIQTGTMSADRITANTITAAQINAASIQAAVLTAGSVTTSTLASDAVTGDKIAGNTITGNNIAGSTITGYNIAGNTITADKILADSITAAQIQSGAIGTDQLASRAITADKLAVTELIVSQAQIGNLVVGTSNMQDNSITTFINISGASGNISAATETQIFYFSTGFSGNRDSTIWISFNNNTNRIVGSVLLKIYVNGALFMSRSMWVVASGSTEAHFALNNLGNVTIRVTATTSNACSYDETYLTLLSRVK